MRFDLFVSYVLAAILPRTIFTFVYMYPEMYLFPFNLISCWYKVSAPVWHPVCGMDYGPHVLCPQCSALTLKSKLIIGAYRPLVSLVEWYDVSFTQASMAGISPCDLCPIIWYSADLDAPGERMDGEWRIKVWQERPLSRYVFAKLYLDGEPVGVRLLVHRGKNFTDRKLIY